MLLFYVRHGDPIYNPDSLTPLGHEQAKAVSKRLCQFGLDKIYSSDSNRAYLTAKPTADILKLEIEKLPWCNEGVAWKELTVEYEPGKIRWACEHSPIRQKFVSQEVGALGKRWYEYPDFKDTSFKSGMERIQRETDNFMLELGFRHDGENNVYYCTGQKYERVALFAHEGFGGAFLSCLLDIPYPELSARFSISHSGITVIDFEQTDGAIIPKVLTYSNDSHIFAERLPLRYKNNKRLSF